MKKQARKLRLYRETLRALETGDLQDAAGANPTVTACGISENIPCDVESHLCP